MQDNANGGDNRFIRANYRLYDVTDGAESLVEETTADRPFSFISGLGVLLQAFEDQLTPLGAGDTFEFDLTPGQAYGDHDEKGVLKLDKGLFTVDGEFDARRVRVGAAVPLLNEDGQRINGLILDVNDKEVTVDLNHPLAGRTLRFRGEVLENRAATNEELGQFVQMISGEGDEEECHGDGHCKHHGEGKGGGHCCHHHGGCRCHRHRGEG